MKALEHQLYLDAHEWRAKMSNGLSDADQADFDEWIATDTAHAEAFAEAEIMWGALGRIDLKKISASTEVFTNEPNEVADTISEPAPWFASLQIVSRGFGPRIAGGILTIAAVFAIWIFIDAPLPTPDGSPTEPTRFVSGPTSSQAINLPDGSVIQLKPNSELVVSYSEEQRVIEFAQGEAFFNVASAPNRLFLVRTENATIEVTGTRFTTELRDGGVEIGVVEGSVDVYASVGEGDGLAKVERISLTAGKVIWTENGRDFIEVPQVEPKNTARSTETEPINDTAPVRRTYRNEPLSSVVADMNRYAASAITVAPEVADIELTGTFNVSDTKALLATIDVALPVQISRDEQGVRLIPEPD